MNMDPISEPAPVRLPREVVRRLAEEKRRMAGRLGRARRRQVLLVGGSGYVGGPLTAHLLGIGYGVTNLDLLIYRHGSVSLGYAGYPGYRLIVGDMGDVAALDRALEGATDVVLLAGLVGDAITKKFPEESAAINDLALRNCIDRLNGRGLERVIFVSTCFNYRFADGDNPAREDSPLMPLSIYGKSKVAAERHILGLEGRVDYHPTILRFAMAFGLAARMRFDLTVNEFTRELYLDRDLVVHDAYSRRPYCHVKDFARLIAAALAFPAEDVAFEVFNAGSEENSHSKQSIVDIILSRLPKRSVLYSSSASDRCDCHVDFSKARQRLYFRPAHSVADGIDEILWAIRSGLLDDVELLPHVHGNYSLPQLDQLAA